VQEREEQPKKVGKGKGTSIRKKRGKYGSIFLVKKGQIKLVGSGSYGKKGRERERRRSILLKKREEGGPRGRKEGGGVDRRGAKLRREGGAAYFMEEKGAEIIGGKKKEELKFGFTLGWGKSKLWGRGKNK